MLGSPPSEKAYRLPLCSLEESLYGSRLNAEGEKEKAVGEWDSPSCSHAVGPTAAGLWWKEDTMNAGDGQVSCRSSGALLM